MGVIVGIMKSDREMDEVHFACQFDQGGEKPPTRT